MENIYEVTHNFKPEEVEDMIRTLKMKDIMDYMYQLEAVPYKSIHHFGVQVMGIDFNRSLVSVAICTVLGQTMKAIPVQFGGVKTYNWVDRDII